MIDRIARIKERMFSEFQETKPWWGGKGTVLTDEAVKQEPLIVRKALAIKYVLEGMPAFIKDDELIVGNTSMGGSEFGRLFPEYALPEEKEAARKEGMNEMSVWGHHPANYVKMLKLGLSGYRKRILELLSEQLDSAAPDQKKIDLYRAMIISLDALRNFAYRYCELARNMAIHEKSRERRAELFTISEILERIPEQPPVTFHEALLAFWLIYAGMHSCLEFIPAGRADQYLYPYYKHDVDNGTLTEEQARVLLASWLAKLSDRVQFNILDSEVHQTFGDYQQGGAGEPDETKPHKFFSPKGNGNFGIGANSWLMNAMLGGQTPKGEDATNDLTYMILECWNDLELVSPTMSMRFHKNSPEKLYDLCASILRKGSGEPAIYNDEAIIPALLDMGIPLEEALDYCNDGCWEVLVPGKTDHSYSNIEVLLALEHTLFRGRSLVRGAQESMDTGDPCSFKSYDELYDAFMQHVGRRIDEIVDTRIKNFGMTYMIAPDPLLSIFMDDCVERGLDVSEGGARYIMHAPFLTGVSNACDSLAAIKKFVYEDKSITMEEMLHAIETDFEGNEPLRQKLVNAGPKFGNDDDYADSFVIKLLDDVTKKVKERQKDVPWLLLPLGVATFEHYARWGMRCGARADGGHCGETLSSNFSPSVGMDRSGPTAAIRSVLKANLLPYMSGAPLDIQINSNEVSGDAGLERIKGLIKSFKELGGLIFTITGVSEDMLRDAQKHPEKHRGLRVRLGGFCGYFVALPPMHQEIMINRTKHGI